MAGRTSRLRLGVPVAFKLHNTCELSPAGTWPKSLATTCCLFHACRGTSGEPGPSEQKRGPIAVPRRAAQALAPHGGRP